MLIAVCVLTGCGPGDLFFLPPPPEGDRSVIFVLESNENLILTAQPIEGEATPATRIEFDRLGQSFLWALFYDAPLSNLGLSEGRINVREDGSPLPSPSRIRRSTFLGGELSPWEPVDDLDDQLRTLRVERASNTPCALLGPERIYTLDSHASAAFAARFDATTALIGTQDSRLYLVSLDGVSSLGRAAPVDTWSGHLASDGTLYLGGKNGRTFSGRIDPVVSMTEIDQGESRDTFQWMDGPLDGDELFAVTSSGALEHFDGTTWSQLMAPEAEKDWRRGVAWIGPDEALAVGLASPVVRATGGVLAAEPIEAGEPLVAIRHAPGLGTFAGTLGGRVFVTSGDGTWQSLPESPIALPASAIAPFEEGIIVAGGVGFTTQWHPDYGWCEAETVTNPIVKHLVVLEDAVVYLGDPKQEGPRKNNTVVVRPR